MAIFKVPQISNIFWLYSQCLKLNIDFAIMAKYHHLVHQLLSSCSVCILVHIKERLLCKHCYKISHSYNATTSRQSSCTSYNSNYSFVTKIKNSQNVILIRCSNSLLGTFAVGLLMRGLYVLLFKVFDTCVCVLFVL